MMKLWPACLGVLACAVCPTAAACPVCDSATGQQVRAGIFGGDFWTTLAAVAAPFPIIIGLLVVMNLRGPGTSGNTRTPTHRR